MSDGKIFIARKEGLKGEDGYKTFSIRIKETTLAGLDSIADNSNRSRNEIINILLEYGVKNCEITGQ